MHNAFEVSGSNNQKCSMSPVFLPFMKRAAELGECELPEHTPELVSEFRFIPNQTEAMEFDIFQRWKECRYLDATILHSDTFFILSYVCVGLLCLPVELLSC
jgi:hypothetical protein